MRISMVGRCRGACFLLPWAAGNHAFVDGLGPGRGGVFRCSHPVSSKGISMAGRCRGARFCCCGPRATMHCSMVWGLAEEVFFAALALCQACGFRLLAAAEELLSPSVKQGNFDGRPLQRSTVLLLWAAGNHAFFDGLGPCRGGVFRCSRPVSSMRISMVGRCRGACVFASVGSG